MWQVFWHFPSCLDHFFFIVDIYTVLSASPSEVFKKKLGKGGPGHKRQKKNRPTTRPGQVIFREISGRHVRSEASDRDLALTSARIFMYKGSSCCGAVHRWDVRPGRARQECASVSQSNRKRREVNRRRKKSVLVWFECHHFLMCVFVS